MTATEAKPSPIEVWLSQANIEITCNVVHEDESTDSRDIYALSMRGAQREITGYYISQGYEPIGRWEVTAHDLTAQVEGHDGAVQAPAECVRRFRLRREEVKS